MGCAFTSFHLVLPWPLRWSKGPHCSWLPSWALLVWRWQILTFYFLLRCVCSHSLWWELWLSRGWGNNTSLFSPLYEAWPEPLRKHFLSIQKMPCKRSETKWLSVKKLTTFPLKKKSSGATIKRCRTRGGVPPHRMPSRSYPDEFVNVNGSRRPICSSGKMRRGWAANTVQKMSRTPSYLNRSPSLKSSPGCRGACASPFLHLAKWELAWGTVCIGATLWNRIYIFLPQSIRLF